jgi:hypothetical protein
MWAEAANTAVYLKNRAPHKAVSEMVPEEKWSGNKVDLSHLRKYLAAKHIYTFLMKSEKS